ncbi:MAG: methyltransferase domain-containing protein, partial [Spirochaetia bacterium]|nr:methyltransferase domain-containing protein [Spirochaetia bacterium]
MDIETLKKEIQGQVRSSMLLSTAFIGIHNHLFDILHSHSRMAAELLAKTSNSDLAYLKRWLDAAYSFGLIDEENENFFLTETGLLFTANHESSMMGAAIQAVLGAHMADRISALMKSGERPGESILLERPSIAQNFGVMLEKGFSPLFNQIILPGLAFFKTVNENRGSILDLGCGNGWYLRNIAKVYPDIKGTGVDGFSENINEAKRLSEKEGLHKRLDFSEGDL